MKFDLDEFYRFSKSLRIDSKELGVITLGNNLLGTQHRLIEQMTIGLEAGIREFVTLKCRQIGVSTLSLAFDLYWIFKYRGLNGALVTHDDGARDQFRTTLALYRSGLPDEWTRAVIDDNRNQLVLENGSKLMFRVAGTTRRGAGKLGRSGALAFGHMTETAFWGDSQGIDSLRSSFAEHNPVRLYHWESTANGFNHYHDMWQESKKSVTQKAIFISWWANEFYRAEAGGDIYQTYWGNKGRMTADEKDWCREVKLLYDHDIEPEQLAWYRWLGNEKITDDMMLAQEFPPTEERAFVATGQSFFSAMSITTAIKSCKVVDAPSCFRIETGQNFWDTRLISARAKQTTLKIWAEPVPGAQYVIGCDPAYASSEHADRSAISVWRCWYNHIEQVAEFASREIPTHAVAWIMAYLAGWYERCATNIEVNGPGNRVLEELQNLKRQASSRWDGDRGVSVMNVVKYMTQYIYRRPDSFNGISGALHTKTSYEIKERMMNGLRDYFERGMLVIRSLDLIEEMKSVVREGGSAPGAPVSKNDDRVVAAALAVMCWNDQMRQQLLGSRVIWQPEEKADEMRQKNPTERCVQNYLVRVGLMPPLPGIPEPRKMGHKGRVPWGMTARRADKVLL